MLKALTRREKAVLFLTIGIITFSLGFNFVIEPILKKNETLNKEINLKRARLAKYSWLLKQKDAIQNKYDKFSSTFRMPLQQQDSGVLALSELEALAKNANIKIIDIRPQAARDLNLYKELLVELRAEGSMEGLLKFIYDIENSLLLLRFKKIQISAKPNSQFLEGSFSLSQLIKE